MLPGLGHNALVRRNHKQSDVNPPRPSQHVADELFVAGHIDDARPFPIGKIEIRKAQLNGNTAPLFFLQPIGIHAGKRPD